ncbi:MAG: hypothetical protein HY401_10210 [Elusimicrobia bacterium]|nr:hypothetical protein [Elusimicrobiota bacterium]
MKRSKITKVFFKFPALQFLYQFEWIKKVYKLLFVAKLPNPQYYIELVNQCNAECIFCPYPILRDQGKPQTSISDEFFDQTLALINSEKRSYVSLTPTTGEVFMNPRWDYYLQRILDLDFVEDVHFYSNAALLNAKNREKFFEMRHLDKMSIAFSTGGADRETYQLMFGKDLFSHVERNINDFLRHLSQNEMTIPVSIDIKMPKDRRLAVAIGQSVYNQCEYPYAFVKIRNTFDTFGGLIQNQNIEEMAGVTPSQRKKPCHYLNDIRFAANGEVWLCGCVISELPDHEELKVGHLGQDKDLTQIRAKQRTVQDNWRNKGDVPYTCRKCTWYVAN